VVVALSAAGPVLDRLRPAVLFSDVDATLVGKGASLLADLDGRPTLAAAGALVAAREAGLEVVLVSGRTRAQLFESGRLIGLRDAIAELGTVLVVDGQAEVQWGQAPAGLGLTPVEALTSSGALELVLDTYAGRLEYHTPWHTGRQGTVLLRGLVDPAEVGALLDAKGLGWARLLDNGRLRGAYPHLGLETGQAHAYHLCPAGTGKGVAAAAYLARRGLERERAAAVGDSTADLELAGAVGAMFLVANATEDTRSAAPPDTIVTDAEAGAGWAQAVSALIARMRG
jgi:hydroxymethylpyrimidine pyrophosphatase-like HAD family hydrolase